MKSPLNLHTTATQILLQFHSAMDPQFIKHLQLLGFTKNTNNPLNWSARLNTAYLTYAKALQNAFMEDIPWQEIPIAPSKTPTKQHLDNYQYSYVIYSLDIQGSIQHQEFLIFETYQKIAHYIVAAYGKKHFGAAVTNIKLIPYRKINTAKVLFEQGRIIQDAVSLKDIDPLSDDSLITENQNNKDKSQEAKNNPDSYREQKTNTKSQNTNPIAVRSKKQEATTKSQIATSKGEKKEKQPSNAKRQLSKTKKQEIKNKLEIAIPKIQKTTPHPIAIGSKTLNPASTPQKPHSTNPSSLSESEAYAKRLILDEVLHDLEQLTSKAAAQLPQYLPELKELLYKAQNTQSASALYDAVTKAVDLWRGWYDSTTTEVLTFQLLRLIDHFKLSPLKVSLSKTLEDQTQTTLTNTIVPKGMGVHFALGDIKISDAPTLAKQYPELFKLTNDHLAADTTPLQLFQLIQLPHPTDYGIPVDRSSLLKVWTDRGSNIFEVLGLPTDPNYPYINVHTGYKSIYPFKKLLDKNRQDWWSIAEHYRPVADISLALKGVQETIGEITDQQAALENPKTGKPKAKHKQAHQSLEFNKESLLSSKAVLQEYQPHNRQTTTVTADPDNYLHKVIATMQQYYAQGKRLSKKQIEALLAPTDTPNLGLLWEAVELSWQQWYRRLYLASTPFEDRLQQMIAFWENLQPTYAYSDSSKELYKQYSTPCLIGAMLSEYTQMKAADAIFEPSAGNGLLLVGAPPEKTIVNEIDPSRRRSLEFQRFKEIHALDGSQPFAASWSKRFDVMITNPPFDRWEATDFDKKRIVTKFFNKRQGLHHYMRLEHLMAGLALQTLKDQGRAALIIMGHVQFDPQGFFSKYRPFFNWLYHHYFVDDVINLNGFSLYSKQGAVARTMLILIQGRKPKPFGAAPLKKQTPHLEKIEDDFNGLWQRIKAHSHPLNRIVQQLKIATNEYRISPTTHA